MAWVEATIKFVYEIPDDPEVRKALYSGRTSTSACIELDQKQNPINWATDLMAVAASDPEAVTVSVVEVHA